MAKAIKVENLSKAYQLGDFGTGTISRDLERFWARMRGQEDPFLKIGELNDRTKKGTSDVVWSLKDINFEIQQGDAVGIIGRNGAGKSTLLKILSRVTSPTTGSVKVKGRIASLLEVGTGFHPELSGRENIYLNGAILGMRKAEIKRKFDEIVDFSGVDRYIDTPVKRYSSGMYVRLAFAVAAHLESEILIVDEVLAVGDAEFQKKCLGKMGDVSKGEGRTILFVSHNMAAINQLCTSAISLKNGEVAGIGPTSKMVDDYLKSDRTAETYISFDQGAPLRVGNQKVKFKDVYLSKTGSIENNRVFSIGDSIHILFNLQFVNPNQKLVRTSVELKTVDGVRIANMIDADSGFQVTAAADTNLYQIILKDVRLYPGTYYLSLYAGDTSSTEIYDYLEDCISFEIVDGGKLTNRALPKSAGLLFLTPEWGAVNNISNNP
ncbi:ABC transporter ATP-binding protein [Inquilinus sp. KBS0705]|nr:ABC transporter ATP-binding protein [Inquilinus sp. KBS0705]